MPLLLDTGFIYALADQDDAWHARARSYLESTRELLLVPATVIPEVAYLLRERLGPGAETKFAKSLATAELTVESLSRADFARCVELMQRYEEIGLVDASVVTVAERLRLKRIATTDRRHFSYVRPTHFPAFELVP
ncbi:MAG: PIN domain-containing protein [Planctomycetes bacterium]|nr:PIN domain-containing protein [Planctomycetota bacterium]